MHHTKSAANGTFGQALRRAREERRWTVHKSAQVTSTTETIWRTWEADEKTPNPREFSMILSNFRAMRPWKGWIRDRSAPQTDTSTQAMMSERLDLRTSAIVPTTMALVMPATPAMLMSKAHGTFGDALTSERKTAGLGQDELAKTMDVHQTTVAHWEADRYAPIKDHLDKLTVLFPGLASAPQPHALDINKPGGAPGSVATHQTRRVVLDTAPKVVAAPEPVIDGLSFGAALAAVRVHAGLERLDLAHKLRVSRRVVGGWELGERTPIPAHLEQLAEMFPQLAEHATNALPAASTTDSIGKFTPTFGASLATEREHAGMTRTDLGKVIARSHWTVRVWEQDRYAPSAETYAQLCGMFPALRDAPLPYQFRPGETSIMAAVTTLPAIATAPVLAAAPSNASSWLKLLGAVRRVETAGVTPAVVALLVEAQRTGASVAELLELLAPEAP